LKNANLLVNNESLSLNTINQVKSLRIFGIFLVILSTLSFFY
jgi:hypothetical protein